MKFVWLIQTPGYHSSTVIAAVVVAAMAMGLWRFVSRTTREVARLLDAARHADYSQRFEFSKQGASFRELGEAFTDILSRMQERSSGQEVEMRRLRALIEHIPVPLRFALQAIALLLMIWAGGVELHNFGNLFGEL